MSHPTPHQYKYARDGDLIYSKDGVEYCMGGKVVIVYPLPIERG